jgi:uncharacterized protein (DUF2236 family)
MHRDIAGFAGWFAFAEVHAAKGSSVVLEALNGQPVPIDPGSVSGESHRAVSSQAVGRAALSIDPSKPIPESSRRRPAGVG